VDDTVPAEALPAQGKMAASRREGTTAPDVHDWMAEASEAADIAGSLPSPERKSTGFLGLREVVGGRKVAHIQLDWRSSCRLTAVLEGRQWMPLPVGHK
jgi:hypothetical protein